MIILLKKFAELKNGITFVSTKTKTTKKMENLAYQAWDSNGKYIGIFHAENIIDAKKKASQLPENKGRTLGPVKRFYLRGQRASSGN